VAETTRQRVLAAIADLGYQPSPVGRSLAEGRHGATGVVFPDLSGPYYSEVILGYEDQAAADGHSVLILGTHGREQAEEMVRDLAARVDGLVIMGRTIPDEAVVALDAAGIPLVLLARPPVGLADAIRSENRESALGLTEHLLDHGHTRIAFIGDPASSPDAAERWLGFCAAFERHGLPRPDDPVRSSFREREGNAAAGRVLDTAASQAPGLGGRPTALVCANDEIALGAYGACHERGLRIPDDVAVTGWDDIPMGRFVSPALTTVRQPLRELGARAARRLLERIRGDRPGPVHEVLPTALVVRASCGCQHAADHASTSGIRAPDDHP
jgi:LacI family transcriptional regulator